MDANTFYSHINMCRVCPSTENLIYLYVPSNKTVLNNLKFIVHIEVSSKTNYNTDYINLNHYIQDEGTTELPKFLCEQCMKSLVTFIEFKAKCEMRDHELRENIRVFKSESSEQLTPVIKPNIKEIVFEECLVKPELEIEENFVSENEDFLDFEESQTAESDNSKSSEVDSEIENTKLDTYKCVICKDIFNNFFDFNQHKKNHKDCPDCRKNCLTYAELLKHRVIVHRKKKKYSCLICVKDFVGWSELSEHNKTQHLDCPECSKKCLSYKAMTQHRRNSHYRNENTKCEFCDKSFKFTSTLKIHIRRVHAKERNHKCAFCGKEFFEYSTLKVHLKVHSKIRTDKSFPCDFLNCGYSATNRGNLKKHEKIHIHNKTFPCDFLNCDYTSTNLINLRKHKNIHQKLTDESPAKIVEVVVVGSVKPKVKRTNPQDSPICPYCGKSFSRKAGLDLHIRIHQNDKPYQCEFCLKKFSDSSSLRSHRRIHTDERPYKCDQCEKKFKNSNNLKSHKISAHETEKKFSCHICGKSTKIVFNLHKHMKNVHNIERITKKPI